MKNYKLRTDYDEILDTIFIRDGKYFDNVVKTWVGVVSEEKEVRIGTHIIEYDKDWNNIKIMKINKIEGKTGYVDVLDYVPEKLNSIIENL